MKKLVRFMVLLKPKNDPFHESVFLFKFLQAGHLFKEKRALKCPLLFIFKAQHVCILFYDFCLFMCSSLNNDLSLIKNNIVDNI